MKRFAQILMMLLLGGGAAWLVFKDVDWSRFWHEVGLVDLPMFLLGMVLFLGLHIARSVRWGRLVQAVEPGVRFRSYFSICSVGFFLINILPFRLGEFVRPYLLLDREDVPFGSGLATVLVERVLDVAALGVLFVGVLLWGGIADLESTTVTVGGQGYDLVQLGRTAILAILIPFGGGIVGLLLLGDRGIAITRRIFGIFGSRIAGLVAGFMASFLHAIRSLGSVRAALSQVGWTTLSWTISVCSMWVMMMAFPFGEDMGFWDGATLLVGLCIVLIVPPPPGFAGVFEFAVAIVLMGIYSVDNPEVPAAFGLLVHVCQFALISALGIAFLSIDRISIRGVLAGMKKVRSGSDEAAAT